MIRARTFSLTLLTFTLAGCSGQTFTPSGSANSATAAATIASAYGINVAAATASQCANGGSVYSVFGDINNNGLLEDGEIVTSKQVVCNGAEGAIGATGATGAAGLNGYSMVFQIATATASQCASGGSTLLMAVDRNRNGVFDVADSNLQSITLCNGANGMNGTNAVLPAYTPVEAIMPCGNTVAYKEVLLRLNDGQVLSSFSDNASGAMTRLAFLPDGAYQDTDNSNCTFSLATTSDGKSRSISWLGKIQETWAMTK